MTISRYVVLALIAITAAFPSATSAKSLALHQPLAREVMALYLTEQEELGHNAGYEINDCHRYSRSIVWCFVVEKEVEWDGIGTGELFYRLKAKRMSDCVALLSSPWGDLHFTVPI